MPEREFTVALTEAEINAVLNPDLAIKQALHRGRRKLTDARDGYMLASASAEHACSCLKECHGYWKRGKVSGCKNLPISADPASPQGQDEGS